MKKIFVLFVIFSATILTAQKQRKFIYINSTIIKNDTSYLCYLTYKIEYKNLIFVKKDNGYLAGVELLFEVFENEKVVLRESVKNNVEVFDYEKSKSRNEFLEGFCLLKLPEGKFEIRPTLSIDNTNRDGQLPPLNLSTISDSGKTYLEPFIVNSTDSCSSSTKYKIIPHGNDVPYSINPFAIIARSESEIIKIEIWQADSLIISQNYNTELNNHFEIEECNSLLFLKNSPLKEQYFATLESFNQSLAEGEYELKVFANNDTSIYKGNVNWFNAPSSLSDPEFAIKLLSIVVEKDKVDELLDYPDEEYYTVLKQFWKELDPNKETEFNELMFEFYSRVDYAIKEFKSVNKNNGATSIMGKIFIRFGEPDNIERTYSENYKTIEIWKYTKLKKEFVFIDKNGLGNFELVK